MTDRDLNRRQFYIETQHEEKKKLQQLQQVQQVQQVQHPDHQREFSKNIPDIPDIPDILDILDIRYEDLRRKAIEGEDNKLLSSFPFSQELLIFMQQGMIAWVEEWSKCHPVNHIDIDIDMSDSHKINEFDFIGIDNNTDDNNYIADRRDSASNSFHLSISMDLQAQIKNLLTHMAISTILLSTNL